MKITGIPFLLGTLILPSLGVVPNYEFTWISLAVILVLWGYGKMELY